MNMKKNNSIKTVVAIGIGAALFFVLGRFVAISDSVPNTTTALSVCSTALLAAAMYLPAAGGPTVSSVIHCDLVLGWNSWWELKYHICICRCGCRAFARKLNVQKVILQSKSSSILQSQNVVARVIGWVVVAPYWIF